MYSTSPVQKIVGGFKIDTIIEEEPATLWKLCQEKGGVDSNLFFSYFKGCSKAYAIRIGNVKPFEPFDPKLVNPEFSPPQSFCYTKEPLKSFLESLSHKPEEVTTGK